MSLCRFEGSRVMILEQLDVREMLWVTIDVLEKPETSDRPKQAIIIIHPFHH